MTTPSNATVVTSTPLQDGLYERDPDGSIRLIASHCDRCNRTYFPFRRFCGKCGADNQTRLPLSPTGTVVGFSKIDRKSKHSIIDAPYIQAEVEMPEGVHVFTVLDGCAPEAVRVGMKVEVYAGPVGPVTEGRQAIAYKFRPVR